MDRGLLSHFPVNLPGYGEILRAFTIRSRRYNAGMHDIPNRIADVLLEVEATLRTHGRWDQTRPSPRALDSRQPFCIDTLRFEQWLQWIFLPRMKDILEGSKPLPVKSGIFSYAEHYLHKNDPPTTSLLVLIRRFDDLIAIQSAARPH
jgi:uncharacterized protein YqcC (DUF446 family)